MSQNLTIEFDILLHFSSKNSLANIHIKSYEEKIQIFFHICVFFILSRTKNMSQKNKVFSALILKPQQPNSWCLKKSFISPKFVLLSFRVIFMLLLFLSKEKKTEKNERKVQHKSSWVCWFAWDEDDFCALLVMHKHEQ